MSAFSIFRRKPKTDDSYKLRKGYEDLDNEAYLTYGSDFNRLGRKEQEEISRKVAEKNK